MWQNISAVLIEYFAGIKFNVRGALNSIKSTKLELVNDDYILVTLTNNVKMGFKINQAFLDNDPTQTDALLQPDQVRAFEVIVDDCASRHLSTSLSPGTQCIKVGDRTWTMYFNGWECYYKLENPTVDDLVKYETIELTSRLSYEPQRLYSRRAATILTKEVEAWRSRSRFPTYAVTKNTLVNTT